MNNRSIGIIVLCIWLICVGASAVFSLTFSGMPIILGLLAIAAGILILLGK